MVDLGWINDEGAANETVKTTERGAATQVWSATSESDRAVYASRADDAKRLWALSAELTGVDAFAAGS